MRVLTVLLLLLASVTPIAPAKAQPAGQRFVSISFHDVVDRVEDLDTDAVTMTRLVQFFDWLKGTGWTPISLDDLEAARRGTRLRDKAILITFDDGYKSLYTRVFPLLKVYRYPIVAALGGGWMEGKPGGMVDYGGARMVPRSNFISWDEAREMQASGLVEFASHSFLMHRGIQGNPQGSSPPAAVTWAYDPATRRYEDDRQYAARIRADLARSRSQLAANLGHAPRAMVWPYGRYTGPGLEIAKQLGFTFSVTLEAEPSYTSDLFAIHRYFPTGNPALGEIVDNLRFDAPRPRTRRIVCLRLDAMAALGDGEQDEALGRLVEDVRTLGANTVMIHAYAALSPGAPLGAVFFPTALRPLKADLLSRVTWQLRTRAGVEVYTHMPVDPAVAAVGAARVPALYADMAKYSVTDGNTFDLEVETLPAQPTVIVPSLPGVIRARRTALDISAFTGHDRLLMEAYRAMAQIDPRQRLMLIFDKPSVPPGWADIGLLPPSRNAAEAAGLAKRLRAEGWLRPDAAGRIAFSLPAEPRFQVDALRQAQRQGASAFALCPDQPAFPPTPALSAAFSAATYPYRP
jgi:peptidoglycan/xylan/chitin deacetylase (PgdA/CDA1 family)